jgi:hypothetical protein
MRMKLLIHLFDEIDTQIEDEGYITTLTLIGLGRTATATAGIGSGYIRQITLNNDGYGYTSPPVVSISSAPFGGTNAIAEAITEINSGVYSIKGIVIKKCRCWLHFHSSHYNYW